MTLALDRDFLLRSSDLSVSLYMALHPQQRDLRAAEGCAHMLLGAARDELTRRGVPKRMQLPLLDRVRDALEELDLRKHRDPGLAVLATSEDIRVLPLPESVSDDAVIGHRFYIRPLLRILSNGSFFTLMINAQGARLLECDRYQWTDRTSPALQKKLTEIVTSTELDAGFQQTPVARPHVGSPVPAVKAHAYESPAEVGKAEFIAYLRRIAAAVETELKNERRPLVLVAEAETAGHFRKIAKLPNLLPDGVTLFPNGQGDAEVVSKARELVGNPDEATVAAILEQVTARVGSNLPSVAIRLDDVVTAAYDGRIESVVVAADDKVWGRFDPSTRIVVAHPTAGPDDEELLNDIVIQTLARGGQAFALARGQLPRQALAVATLRY
jgi:hypothetical protein